MCVWVYLCLCVCVCLSMCLSTYMNIYDYVWVCVKERERQIYIYIYIYIYKERERVILSFKIEIGTFFHSKPVFQYQSRLNVQPTVYEKKYRPATDLTPTDVVQNILYEKSDRTI